jgi:DNA-binding beta-propeller fold protein YncE
LTPRPLAPLFAAALAGASLFALGAHAQPADAYKLVNLTPLGAPDRWDYVVYDAPSHRVYVAHADRVSVVDGQNGKLLGEVIGIPGGTHGIAISHAAGQGYTDDGHNGQVIAFDLKTLQITARIPVSPGADAMAFDPASGHVFVIEGDAHKITAIDPATNAVVANIDGGAGLEYAGADGMGSLYVAGVEKRDVVRVNTKTNTVTAHWPITDCLSPHGLAVDAKRRRVFISCENQTMVAVDADNGREVGSSPIGKGTDAAGYDPSHRRVFSSNGMDGTLSVIAQTGSDAYATLATVTTAVSGRTMSVDPDTGRVFIAAADVDPSPTPGGRPKARPGTLKLLFLDPQ